MPTKRSNGKWIGRVAYKGDTHYCGTNHPTKRAAKAAEDDKRAELQRFGNRPAETVDTFAARWADDYPREAGATRLTYKYAAAAIGREFRGVPLRDIDASTARQWANKAPRSTVAVARTMFNDARKDGLIGVNPFAELGLKQSRGRKDIEVPSEAEVYELRDLALREHGEYGQFGAWIVFQAFTLMRPGETAALEWSDIDFEAGEINLTKNLDALGQIKWPKNGNPRRIILPGPAREALRTVPRELSTVDLLDVRRGERRPFSLVFRGKRGGPLREPKMLSYWHPVRAAFRAKHPASTLKDPYELRHFGATYLLDNGCLAGDVQLQMGHSTERLVQERYGHPNEALKRDRLRRAFGENVVSLDVAKESHGG